MNKQETGKREMNPNNDNSEVDDAFRVDKGDKALEISKAAASLIPTLGGLITEILGRARTDRQEQRLREFLTGVMHRIERLEVPQDFVARDEFRELFEETLNKVAEERSADKRRLYADFLLGQVASPGDVDESFKLLKVLESVSPVHIRVLKGLMEDPPPSPGMMGSPSQTLIRRTGMSSDELREAVEELNDLRIIGLGSLNVMMTGRGAEELQGSVTPLGKKLLTYITEGRSTYLQEEAKDE